MSSFTALRGQRREMSRRLLFGELRAPMATKELEQRDGRAENHCGIAERKDKPFSS